VKHSLFIRLADILFSLFGIIILLPVFLIISFLILIDSPGGVIFKQKRVGRAEKDFTLYKFRTMSKGSTDGSRLTIGNDDSRITSIGKFLRKYKLDEIPQLFNVFTGKMSMVGPRPELRKFTDHYSEDMKQLILSVRPGITDMASIKFSNESELLASVPDPENYYISELIPAKIKLNRYFIESPTLGNYFYIIGLTVKKILFGSRD
jgi:lipopolysaccharide/colanic/teichoic acid biosynthesis glycosyltransferase